MFTAKRWTKRLVTPLATAAMILTLLHGVSNVRAHEGSWIDAPYAPSPPTIDGNMTAGEWSGAALVDLGTVSGNALPAALLAMWDATHLYLAYDAVGDTTSDRPDGASVSFDTGHDLANTAGHEDQFWWGRGAPNGEAHLVSDGMTWNVQDSPFNTGLPNETGLDAAYGFGPSPLSAVNHAIYEIQIPVVLLGASPGAVYGFLGASKGYPGVVNGAGFKYSTWPTFVYGPPTLDRYGDLRLLGGGPGAHLELNPPSQSGHAPPLSSIFYDISVVNDGVALDTFYITNTSAWNVVMFNASMNPLPDTDGDGRPDTGPVPVGSAVTIIIRVDTPNGVGCDEALVTGWSTFEPGKSNFAILRSCVLPSMLSPPHSDVGVDTDVPPDGLFDGLEIDVGAFTATPNTYFLQVLLYDQARTTVITAGFSSSFLPPGPSSTPVMFNGVAIYQSGFDGPYLAVLFLIDNRGNLIDEGTYLTGAYLHTDFDPPGARFNPPHSDRGIDTDVPPNGLYDVLAVDVSLAVNTAGTYNVFSLLTDLGGSFISTVAATATLPVGNQTLEVDFPGRDINTRGLDGPYLVHMDLVDDVGTFLGNDTHQTGPYQASQFDPPGALFNPPHSDRGVDLTVPPDGLYEFLEVNASVQVAKAGRYSIVTALWDSSFAFILTVTAVTVDLTPGLRAVPIWFDGLDLRNAGFDGPYIADMVLRDSLGFLDENIWTTAAYAVSDFAPPGAMFNPPHTDRLVDLDADGRADFLAVDAKLNVMLPGTYSVNALLQDSQGRFVGVASGCGGAPLPVGPATCTLMFDGHSIADAGSNGPFFGVLRLYDAYGRLLQVDSYTTRFYPSSAFEPTDRLAPTATASPVPYWVNQAPLNVPFTASDAAPTDGLASVTLWYRHSTDNATWSPWTAFLTMMVSSNPASGSLPFSFPSGIGYYEFQYTATDHEGNIEAPGVAEARVIYRPGVLLGFAPGTITVTAGQQQTIQVRVLGADGQPAVQASPLAVSLTTNSPSGEFRTVGTGNRIVTVTIPAGQSSASVDYYDQTQGTWSLRASSGPTTDAVGQATVNAGPAASVSITPSPAAVTVGDTLGFNADATDAYGNSVSVTLVWSADAALGTIDANGMLTAATRVASGVVTVAVSGAPDVNATADVTLVVGPIASIALNPPSATLAVDATASFTATVHDTFGNTIASAPLTWSAVGGIGSISASGLFSAGHIASSGEVHATAGGVTQIAPVTVNAGPTTRVLVSPSSKVLMVGGTQTFTAQSYDAYGNPTTGGATWTAGAGLGTISNSGTLSAATTPAAGDVTATIAGVSGTAAVTLVHGVATTIQLTPGSATMQYGTSLTIRGVVVDQYDNPIPEATIGWSASGPGSVSPASGATTTLSVTGAGSVTVTATSGTSLTASAQFTVLGPPPTSEPSNAPVVGGIALATGVIAGLGLGWVLRGRRGRRKEEPDEGADTRPKPEEEL